MAPSARILIVDDEPFNVEYLEQELEDAHYQTISAANGQEALARVESDAPDLVLLDIMMPVMDGFEVLRRLKANPATRHIPVIVISASNSLESVVKGIQLGAEDYLPKPFEPVLLHARVVSSLEKKHLRDLEQLYLQALQHEMDIARDIQRSFLPPELPSPDGWALAAYFKAAREVAGDFYDAFLLPDGGLVVAVGDVCGKGVGAALFMTLFRSLIRATLTTDLLGASGSLSPAERLQHAVAFTNRYVAETHEQAGTFATMFLGIFDAAGGRLSYVTAGHERPLLSSAGCEPVALSTTGPAVGVIPEASFAVKEVAMKEGDLLFIFTDGIPEAVNGDGRFFGKEPLPALVQSEREPDAVLNRIETTLSQFVGGADPADDITMMAVRRT